MENKVAASLSTPVGNILAVKSALTVDCQTVTVYFLGKISKEIDLVMLRSGPVTTVDLREIIILSEKFKFQFVAFIVNSLC